MGPVRCPSCRREVEWEGNPDRPFCSERCKLLDLGNWASERYRVPVGDQAPPSGDDAAPEAPDRRERSRGS